MKKVLLAACLLCIGFGVSAAPYVGVSQGVGATSVEIGFLTKSFEENVSIGVPSVMAMDSFDPDFYKTVVIGTDLFYRFSPVADRVVFGFGPTFRAGWETGTMFSLMAGLAFQVSLETPGVMDILYLEGAYIPDFLEYRSGSPSNDLFDKAAKQWLRLGWRHAF